MYCTQLAENTGPKNRQNWPSGHYRTILSGDIFATKARRPIDNRKKPVKQQHLPTYPHNMVNFGLLAAEIISLVWGIPANINGFRVLAALLHGMHSSSGRQPNFAAFSRGRHLYLAGQPSRWALAHILVHSYRIKLECGPMPNVMAALPNIGGAVLTPQSLADAHYWNACRAVTLPRLEIR